MKRTGIALLALCLVVAVALPGKARAEENDLDQLLKDASLEYARGYLEPLVNAFGINQNTGLFHTAHIASGKLSLSLSLQAMATHLEDKDHTFRRTMHVTLDERYGFHPGDDGYGQQGDLVMEGPTVFGDEDTPGTTTAYYMGLPVYQEEGIEGLVDTDWVPLAAPQASLGGIAGLCATVRWVPDIDAGDIGTISYFGWGLQWNANTVLPLLPVDVMVGFFTQDLDVGDDISTHADSYFLAASKKLALLTVYGGVTIEDSSVDVDYVYHEGQPDEENIHFHMDGVQDGRFTVGGVLDLGLKLNAEVGFGDYTTFGAGLLFGM